MQIDEFNIETVSSPIRLVFI